MYSPAIATSLILFSLPSILADCTRASLLAAAKLYVDAQTSGTPTTLPLSTNFNITENNKPVTLSTSVLSKPLKIDLTHSTADTVQCASYTMLISSTGKTPYVLSTQIRHNGNDTSKISLIETIAATTGSLFFNASLTLSLIKAEDWSPLNGILPSRDTLQKAVDAYLDMWTDAKASATIPWGSDCERVEGSRLTTPCGTGMPKGGSKNKNGNRRYVIDESMGSVDVLCAFNSLGDMPDSHEIKIIDGKVKYVHTVTVIR